MTPRDLLARLCVVYGVENLAQLSKKIGVEASQLYRWQKGRQGPSFQHTLELLRLAGMLNEHPQDQAQIDPLREELATEVERLRRLGDDLQRHLDELARPQPKHKRSGSR